MKPTIFSNKKFIAGLCVLLVAIILLSVILITKNKNKTISDSPEAITSTSTLSDVNSKIETITQEPISENDDNNDEETDFSQDEDEEEAVSANEQDAYKLIGTTVKEYGGYPCADGGNYAEIRNCYGYSYSTHSDKESDTIKTIYINGYNHYIMDGVYTGKTFYYYRKNINNITDITYDTSSFSYVSTFKSSVNSTPVTVYLYFNSPDGKCTGAIISTLELKGKYTGNNISNNFILKNVSLPLSDSFSDYSELKGKIGIGIYSYENINVNIYFFETNTDYSNVSKYNNSVISSINFLEKDNKFETIDIKDYEILPSLRIGMTYNEIISKGYGFIGDISYSDYVGKNGCFFTFRVGAANLESYIFFDENNRLIAEDSAFICKTLCN